MKLSIAPNRIAVYLTSIAGLFTMLAPVVADLDTSTIVGLVGGVLAIAAVVNKWLEGWQKHEERQDNGAAHPSEILEQTGVPPGDLPPADAPVVLPREAVVDPPAKKPSAAKKPPAKKPPAKKPPAKKPSAKRGKKR